MEFQDDVLWLDDDGLDDDADFAMFTEMKTPPELRDEDLGLRSLLARPEVLRRLRSRRPA